MGRDILNTYIEDIKSRKIEAIKSLIDRREVEQYFIDFKLTVIRDYSNKYSLENNDRENLAKAISGFGNSEGGIIIWGVETKIKGNKCDYAKMLRPITNPENFSSCINSEISRLTIPAHDSVYNIVVKENDTAREGFVVTIIPKSNKAPHQVIKSNRYYMRAGDSFMPVPHAILAGMFGRRPSPNVFTMFTLNPSKEKIEDGYITFSIGIQIVNDGMGIARDVYLNTYMFGVGENHSVATEITNTHFTGYQVFGIGLNMIAKPSLILAPEQRIQPLAYHCKFKPPFEEDIILQIMTGAEGQPPYRFEAIQTKEEMGKLYQEYLNNPGAFCFAERFLKREKKSNEES